MLSGQLSSTHCFDILNRVLVKAGQWQLSLQLMKCMENDNFIPNGMHVASTCRVVMENRPPLAPELLRTALKQWKIVATSNEIRMWHCNLPRILQRAGCNLSILAWQPGILAIAKPPDRTSESILEYLRDKVSLIDPDLASFTSVSRLDYPTSGVLIIAHGFQNSAATHWLQTQFASRLVKKGYLCLVEGTQNLGPVGSQGEIRQPLLISRGFHSRNGPAKVEVSDVGQEAYTKYEVLQRFTTKNGEIMYLRVMPLTGRMHQIRVHFASLGCPLVSGPHLGKVKKQQEAFKRSSVHNSIAIHG